MNSITNDVTAPRPSVTANGGQLKNSERQQGAEIEQHEVRKEQQMINELAQQKATATTTSTNQSAVAAVQVAKQTSQAETKSNAHSSRAPNWSQLSAEVNGYTQLQRAMNLYQRINNLS